VLFSPVSWENIPGGAGRPQQLINQYLEQCDFFVLVLWDRWGSRPSTSGDFTSGTEEEFDLACKCLKKGSMKKLVLLFRRVGVKLRQDPGEQLKQVLALQRHL